MSRVSAQRSKSYLLISGRESRRVERDGFTHFKVLHALADLLDVTCALGSHDKRSFRRGIDSALSRHQILEAQSAGNREERVKVPAQSITQARSAFSNLARSLRDGLSPVHMRRFLGTVPFGVLFENSRYATRRSTSSTRGSQGNMLFQAVTLA